MNKLNLDHFARAFPSDNTLRKCNFAQATRDTMILGNELSGNKTHLACDKGNKRGVGHFVKVLSKLSDQGLVQTQLLDVDASGGTSKDCALAIQSSMNKLKINDEDNAYQLHGQATDSGGGGVLESLFKEMKELGLTAPENECHIANCCIHSLQVQLSNAVKATFGEGALDRVNVTQLLHSTWRLQESIDLDEWRHVLFKSNEWVLEHTAAKQIEVVEMPEVVGEVATLPQVATDATQSKKKKKTKVLTASQKHEATFKQDFEKIVTFHSKFKIKVTAPTTLERGSLLGKMDAPILTWWWTVGSASSYAFDYYLVLFHACQTVINMHSSTTTPNIIASKLFSLMKNQETFIDLCLLRGFHKAYINHHFDWLQSCNDLSGALGFSAHHIAIRFYLMDKDLRRIMSGRGMDAHTEACERWTNYSNDKDATVVEREKHLAKLSIFVHKAHESLFKHFPRWVCSSLLPAALLSEGPAAQVVAAIMLDKPLPTFESDPTVKNDLRMSGAITYESAVHKEAIDLRLLYRFLQQRVTYIEKMENPVHNGECAPQALLAADFVSKGNDLRSKVHAESFGALRWHMQSTYLPLASQTQFVESLVKDAAHVSQTDRSEQHRSCYATIRSATPLTRTEKNANANRIKDLIQSAHD